MPMLTIKNLTKSYNDKKILDGLNLAVNENEIVAVMGKSGSGKTTLLLCILGFIVPEAGEISFDGQNIISLPIEKKQIAYVPQDYGLFPHLSVQDNIGFGLAVRGQDAEARKKKVRELLKIAELPDELGQRNVEKISGGEKQRVALARALAIQPKLFLLDEPLSAIDIETKESVGRELRALIKKLRLPAIIITHDPTDAKNLGDTLYYLNNGKLEKK
ncbi:MAG: ABC transporter ATP-binding protein [Parcubacteria group bacterium]|nr:ABC transporter ATP-binding protein [Parcubacteria group bacterium]